MGDEPEGLTGTGPRSVPGQRNSGRAGVLGTDFRFAVRQLRRHPAFTAVAVLTLALGIGVTTAMFSVVHRLLLEPIPYRDGDRIVRLYMGMRGIALMNGPHVLVEPTEAVVRAWRDRSHAFEQVVSLRSLPDVAVGAADEPELVNAMAISADVPAFLGVRPILGRGFATDEAEPGSEPVVLLGYGLWRSRFGGARDVVGRALVVDGKPRTIIGVMPPGIALPGETPVQVWLPLVIASDTDFVLPLARLRPGVSVNAARRELSGILATMQVPGFRDSKLSAEVELMRDYLGSQVEQALVLVAGAVAVVLLVACANVANLLLSRAAGRQRELSMRTALGASRRRLVRQFTVESLCITVSGGALGVLLAWCVISVVVATRPGALDALDAAKLDTTAIVWTVGVSIATAFAFGMVPLVIGAGRNPADVLKSASRTASGARDARRTRATLIVGEIALSVTLLVGAGVVIRSVRALERENVGFDPHGVSAIYVQLPMKRYPSDAQQQLVLDELLERSRHIQGVTEATLAGGAPPFSGITLGKLEIEGEATVGDSAAEFGFNAVRPDYFHLLRLPVVEGRILDGDTATNTAMVSTDMARHFWPGASALGKRFRFGQKDPWHVVVGVVAETRSPGATLRLDDQVYEPYAARGAALVIRTNGLAPNLLAAVSALAHAIDPQIRLRGKPMEAEFAALFAGRRFAMFLLSVFAGFALVLSAVGLYGVIAYAVVQRTREMGVRVALGASPSAIQRLVLRDSATMVAVGLLAGTVLTLLAARVARSVLADVGSLDAVLFVGVSALLAAVALIASYLPARRASLVDPAVALRAE